MAYGVKYRGEWRATTRGIRNYVVDILQRDYTGDILPIHLTGNCVTLTFGEVDESELHPIKSSEATITILCTEEGNPYLEFFTLDPAQFQVVITENDAEIWRGYLATGDYQQTLSRAPYTVRLRANDGFGILKAMPYLDGNGNKFDTTVSVSSLLRRLLSPISESVDIWDHTPVYATQTSPTFDITSIPDSSIYNAFGDEVPTYYDVLEEVLRTFGVQLFQHDGALCIRSLSMLANALDSMVVNPIELRGADANGLGIKSDATLSFLQPLRKLSVGDKETSDSVDLSGEICAPTNWYSSDYYYEKGGVSRHRLGFTKFGKALKVKATKYANPALLLSASWNILPTVISRSATTKITLSVDIYNSMTRDVSSLYMGVMLVAPGGDSSDLMKWVPYDESSGNILTDIEFGREAIYWDAENSKWVSIGERVALPKSGDLGMQKVTLEKSNTGGLRPSLSTLTKSTFTVELPEIPSITTSGVTRRTWQIAVVAAMFDGNVVYFSKPTVTIEGAGGEDITSDSSISISNDGIIDEDYSPKWLVGQSNVVDIFHPSLVSATAVDININGYITPMADITGNGVIGKMLRDLRRKSTRLIEGETDKPMKKGLNTVATYDGRYYYVNSIERDLKNGLSSIQLRELLQLSEKSGDISVGTLTFNNIELPVAMIGLERSLYYLTSKNRLMRREVPDGAAVHIATAELGSPILSKGVGCVVLAEGTASANKVRAYDDAGKLVAQVDNFSDDLISWNSWLATARYDAIAQVWIASNQKRSLIICDSDGYVVSRFECKDALSGVASEITDAEIMPYNGGFYYRFYIPYEENVSAPGYQVFWHCYSIHKSGEFDEKIFSDNIRLVSERFIAYINANNQWGLISLASKDYVVDGNVRFVTFGPGYSVVALNNAIVVAVSENRVAVYDMRNTVMKHYTLGMNAGNSPICLCGDIVYTRIANIPYIYQWRRVIPIVGDGWKALGGTREQFTFRPSAGDKSVRDESAVIRRIKGNTIVWSQYVRNGNFAEGTRYFSGVNSDLSMNNDGAVVVTSKIYNSVGIYSPMAEPIPSAHKVLVCMEFQRSSDAKSNYVVYLFRKSGNYDKHIEPSITSADKMYQASIIDTTDEIIAVNFYPFISAPVGDTVTIYKIMLFDLTDLFGAGNEPTTYEEFRQYYPDAYYPYCAPEIRSMRATGIETIGFNAFNGEYAEVIGGQAYYLGGAIDTAHFATEIGGELEEITIPEDRLYTPSENGYIYATGSGICINLSHSGVRNGEYESYEKNTLLLPEIAKYFPDGMHSIGDVYDEINQKWAIQRCATRAYQQGDENDALVKTDKINTVYMLAEPIYTLINETLQLDYKVDDFGTEKMLSNTPSSPFKADIEY